jgi:hypothetical protein
VGESEPDVDADLERAPRWEGGGRESGRPRDEVDEVLSLGVEGDGDRGWLMLGTGRCREYERDRSMTVGARLKETLFSAVTVGGART